MDLPKLPKTYRPRPLNFFSNVFWSTRDDKKVEKAVLELGQDLSGGIHFGDNLLTWARNMSMLEDTEFVRAWESNLENDVERAIVWRRYILACSAYHAVQLDGDFVECGCSSAVGVKTVVDYLGAQQFPKTFWAYDLFEHAEGMEHPPSHAHGPDLYNRVRRKFHDYPQVKVIRGLIPDSFEHGCPEKVAYLHIDMNEVTGELAALDVLFDRMVPGGVLILDDYEWAGIYRKQKEAEDAWFEARSYRVMPLPTGQGLVYKR